jgi:hypothetical protein
MRETINKIGKLAHEIVAEKGEIAFFALVLREDDIVWEILVSAQWIDDDRSKSLKYIVSKVQSALTKKELLTISGIVLLQHRYFLGFSPSIDSEDGWEASDIELYGVALKKAYIFIASDTELQVVMS